MGHLEKLGQTKKILLASILLPFSTWEIKVAVSTSDTHAAGLPEVGAEYRRILSKMTVKEKNQRERFQVEGCHLIGCYDNACVFPPFTIIFEPTPSCAQDAEYLFFRLVTLRPERLRLCKDFLHPSNYYQSDAIRHNSYMV